MDSITLSGRKGQVSRVNIKINPYGPSRGVKVYPYGLHIDSPLKGIKIGGPSDDIAVGDRRGKITGFSAAARRRMRHAMLTMYIPNGRLIGLTLTVPWKATDFGPLMDEFRECWNRFTVAFRRKFPKSAIIYRVELQTRGAPHIHALVWLAPADAAVAVPAPVAGAATVADAVTSFALRELWSRAVPDLHNGSIAGFEEYGVKVEPIADAGAMFRYLADHASKHKQAQLGYKGKQWGIIARGNLSVREPLTLPPFDSPRHEFRFKRLLRKVMRYRLQAGRHPNWSRLPPFGSVLKGSRRAVGDFYLRQDTALKMWECSR